MCNDWCIGFVQRTSAGFPPAARILEAGAYNVNGSARDVLLQVDPARTYIGTDQRAGQGVDRVIAAEHLGRHFGAEFDVVLSTDMLEHAANWRDAMRGMVGCLKPGGLLVLTTCTPGFPYHPYPQDCWRYTEDDLRAACTGALEVVSVETDDEHDIGLVAKRTDGDLTEWRRYLDSINVHTPFETRVNFGCGDFRLPGYVNVDVNPQIPADVHADALEYLAGQATESIDDIYAGHFIEHLSRNDADAFLDECFRVLRPGGRLGVVVPDTWEVMRRYVNRDIDAIQIPLGTWRHLADLDDVSAVFLYSPREVQVSPHLWAWDRMTLARALAGAGFEPLIEIDRYRDVRLMVGAWYQCGFDGMKPGAQT